MHARSWRLGSRFALASLPFTSTRPVRPSHPLVHWNGAWRVCSISSYGDRPNEFEEVSEYFRAHFIQVHKRKDVSHRPLYLVRPPVRHHCCVSLSPLPLPLPPSCVDSHRARLTLSFSFHFFPRRFVDHHCPLPHAFLFPLRVSCPRHAAAALADPTLLSSSPQHFTSMLVRISSFTPARRQRGLFSSSARSHTFPVTVHADHVRRGVVSFR